MVLEQLGLSLSSSPLLAQLGNFLMIFSWGMIAIAVISVLVYQSQLKYVVEFNIKTGAGIEIKRVRMRLINKDGKSVLKSLLDKREYKFPDNNKYIYKMGKKYYVRFYIPDATNYYPIAFEGLNEDMKLKSIPQEVSFFHRIQQKEIALKYQKEGSFMQKYGVLIGYGALIMGFVIAMYFMMDNVSKAIDLGSQILSTASNYNKIQVLEQAPQ